MDVLAEIERDLGAFADPGTPIIVDKESAVWEQNGSLMNVVFKHRPAQQFPDLVLGEERLSYAQFLAGPQMANLKSLAGFIQKTTPRNRTFIETSATWMDDDAGTVKEGPATELIRNRAIHDLPFLSTRVVLVQGEAGSGKTIALREMAVRQAVDYEVGKTSCLFFYVDAQGRALARLEEAMAKDLQDLRSRFSYAAIAPLTRRHLIVPIIDGFDELLGSGGYDEAFASLAAFLSTLDGQGVVIASARSAFFDYRNFYENAQRFSRDGRLNYEVEPVTVMPWTQSQVEQYVGTATEARERDVQSALQDFADLTAKLNVKDRDLLQKPFYVARLTELVFEGADVRSENALLDQLVDAFLSREKNKLLDKEGRPLLSEKGHHDFLTQLAEEMWWQESKRIDVTTVQTIAEIVAETYALPPGSAHSIVERVSSYAFLTTDGSARKYLRFEHEVFYGYFLAHKLQEFIEREPADLRRFLNRAVLDETLLEQAVRLVGTSVERGTRAVEAIVEVVRPALSDLVARENGGRLVAQIMRQVGSLRNGIRIRNIVIRRQNIGPSALEAPHFENVDFEEVNFADVRWNSPAFVGCALRGALVDVLTTRFRGADASILSQVHSVIVTRGDGKIAAGRVFDPAVLLDVFRAIGVTVPDEKQEAEYSSTVRARIELLIRFLTKMQRRFYISEEDLSRFGFARTDDWNWVRDALERNGLLEAHVIPKSGPKEALLRLSLPPEIILAGASGDDRSLPASVRALWRALEE